jgi:hypothetical protein
MRRLFTALLLAAALALPASAQLTLRVVGADGQPTVIVQADELPADGVVQLEPDAVSIDGSAVEAMELSSIGPPPRSPVTKRYARPLRVERICARCARSRSYRPQPAFAHDLKVCIVSRCR